VSSPPTGMVTFLFTDVEGSTRLWEEDPAAMRELLVRHEAALRGAIEGHRGLVFKTLGDSFCAAFDRATDAVCAAIDAQRGVGAAGPLRVRVALYTGEADERDGDYFGQPLNRCGRILMAGHGGQVVLSRATAHLVREGLPEGGELVCLGEHRLRDLAQPEELFQLTHPDLPSEFPPLRSLASFAHNLPIQVTSLVGREEELAAVRGLLGTTRLLTLTGSGGAGKTRLALQVGADVLDEYADGVWLVELAAVTDERLVPQVAATALGLREEPGRPIVETLLDAVRAKRLLLILDNCEHLVRASGELAERIIGSCPDVRVLATSREVLGAAGEVTWRVPSLALPPTGEGLAPRVETVSQYAAVRLFIERAESVLPGFAVTNDSAPAVAEICWRLDGIPLAIELAAARVNVLSTEQILARLDDRFRLLTGGRRTALPRQQTLRAAVDWSYALLTAEERVLFRRVSVFAGGFTLEAAEQVCSGGAVLDPAVLDLLASLVRKSLVAADVGGGTRYRLLETLRAYGREKLMEAGDFEDTSRRHWAAYMALAQRARLMLSGVEEPAWLARLDADHGNLREALSWAVRSDPASAPQLAASLVRFWDVRCHWTEGEEWLLRCLNSSTECAPELRAEALAGAGLLAYRRGAFEVAETLSAEALPLATDAGACMSAANALNTLAMVAQRRGDYPRARSLHEEGLAARRRAGDLVGVGRTVGNIGLLAEEQGDDETARRCYEESLAIARELGDRSAEASASNNLAGVLRRRGDTETSRSFQARSLELLRELGDRKGEGAVLCNMGLLAENEGDLAEARALYEQSLAVLSGIGAQRDVAISLRNLAGVVQEQGDLAHAHSLYTQATEAALGLGDRMILIACIEGMAVLRAQEAAWETAAVLFAAAEALRTRDGLGVVSFDRDRYEAYLAAAREGLGDAAFALAWQAGRQLSPHEAGQRALEE